MPSLFNTNSHQKWMNFNVYINMSCMCTYFNELLKPGKYCIVLYSVCPEEKQFSEKTNKLSVELFTDPRNDLRSRFEIEIRSTTTQREQRITKKKSHKPQTHRRPNPGPNLITQCQLKSWPNHRAIENPPTSTHDLRKKRKCIPNTKSLPMRDPPPWHFEKPWSS